MKVTWKSVDEVWLRGYDSGLAMVTFGPIEGSPHKPFGIAIPLKDLRGFADFFAALADREDERTDRRPAPEATEETPRE